MKNSNIPILSACLSLIGGILIADFWEVSIQHLLIGISIVFVLLIFAHMLSNKKSSLSGLFTILTSILFVGVGCALHQKSLPKNQTSHFSHFVKNDSQTILLEIKESLKPTSYQDKYVAQIYAVNGTNVSGLILVNIDKDSLPTEKIKIGDRFAMANVLQATPTPKNPYQFDYGAYLKRKRIYAQTSISHNELFKLQSTGNGIRVVMARFRESVQEKLTKYNFSQEQLSILNALVLGQRQGIDKEMSEQYAAAGMMHILAVSGLHVGIILLILRFITRPIAGYKMRYARSGIIIFLIWAFAILTGLSPSVLRAATMFSFLEASTLFGSKKESSNALVASAFLLLLYDPLLIYQVGFQLSYLAVIAILWIQPWLSGLVTTQNKLLRLLWDTASVTTAAQLGVMPLSLFYFHQFPGLFLVSNVVIIPFLGVLLGCGIVVVLLANFNILPDFVVKVLGYLIDLLNNFIGWVASKEAFVFKHITISLLIMLGMYLVIICIFRLLKKYTYNRLLLAGVALLLFLCILSFEEMIPKRSQLIIFHKGKQTLLAQLSNEALNIKSSDSLRNYEKDSRIKALLDNVALDTIQNSPIPNVISFKSKRLLIVDSLGVYAIPNYNPKYILLRQSPNINLHRLIDTHPNVTIIADGTNYRSDIPRWKATCRKRKIPFHSTYEKGAYIIE